MRPTSWRTEISLLSLFTILPYLCTALTATTDTSTTLFSIKTPYSYLQNDDLRLVKPSAQCTVKQLNMVHRHGHRFPSKSYILKFRELAEKIDWNTGNPDQLLGLPWDPPLDENHKSHLTHVGENELYNIGLRTRARFAEVFERPYNSRRFRFISTNKLRTTHSTNSLGAGLFDGVSTIHQHRIQPIALEVNSDDDKTLKFYSNCERYKKAIVNNESAILEFHKFTSNSPEVKRVAEKVQSRTGRPDLSLTYRNLDAIFVGCTYEIAMFGGSMESGLCALLDEDDRMVIEYANDLENFYISSDQNNPLSYKIACPLLKEIIRTLQDANKGRSSLLGIFRSAHSTAILMLYTLLKLNEQSIPLRHDNYDQLKGDSRHFRSSLISPFAANINFVLYECDEGRTKIQLYWNERLQKIPCCSNDVDCDFEVFLKCYEDITDNCDENFEEFCEQTNQSNAVEDDDEVTRTESSEKFFFTRLLAILFSVFVAIFKKYVIDFIVNLFNNRKR